jgi:type II secretory pathway component GspD/PulD (secretin)
VILRVTPSIDERGRILMKIHPEVSTASVNNNIPSKNSTQVNTTLIAEDGQSIFIGGLIRNSNNYKRAGIPLLGDIPGDRQRLFPLGRRRHQHRNRGGDHPRIIRDAESTTERAAVRLQEAEPPMLRSAVKLEHTLERLRPQDERTPPCPRPADFRTPPRPLR